MSSYQARGLTYERLARESKKLEPLPDAPEIRIALLSDASTQHIVPLLRALLHRAGFNSAIYEGAFDAIEFEAYDSNSALYRFRPDAIVLLNSVQALRARFYQRQTDAIGFLNTAAQRVAAIWDALQARSTALILQSNFVLPYERHFGNFDQKVPQSLYSVTAALNTRIAESARGRAGVLIHDVESVASWAGRRTWFDDRFWDLTKSFCAMEHLPLVAHNIVDILMAARGRTVKCVITDLDNTLWGGVIGDDGLDGIRLNAHGDGEAHYRLQQFLRELKNRGILLAVCSKNDLENALLPFEKHPEMALRREDITVFVANWKDKAENIRAIRETLNIGFDSMVFLDDNPFERNLVRELIPGIIVPELPEDPADYVRAISELNLFETISFSSEDLVRAELYQREAERREAAAGFASVEEFLQSLDMRITIARFDSFHLPRIAQLIQRSNQFNLTTRRHSESECEALMRDEAIIPLYVKLSDRLGDHGLISIVVLEPKDGKLVIRDWLMSCRVLVRGVEQCVMNHVFALAAERGLAEVTGEYIPTAKNGMVRDFFAQFGFRKISETGWSRTTASYEPIPVFIQPVELEAVTA